MFGRTFAVTQFLLDILYLLLQEVFALLFVDVFARFRTYGLLNLQQLHLLVQGFQGDIHAFERVVGLQHVHLIVKVEGHVRADEVGSDNVVVYVCYGKLRLVGHFLVHLDKFHGLTAKVFHGRMVFARVFVDKYFGFLSGLRHEIRLAFHHVF